MANTTQSEPVEFDDPHRNRELTFWIVGLVVFLLFIVALIARRHNEKTDAAETKALQLQVALTKAGLLPPSSDQIVNMLGEDGDVVWYAPDQSFRKKGAQMVTLFGIPAATNTATSRIAGMTKALVLPYFFERLPGGGYRGTIHPPLDNFPTDDAVADSERFNRIVEAEVRRMPAQYLWIHRRFKGLTPDYPRYYD